MLESAKPTFDVGLRSRIGRLGEEFASCPRFHELSDPIITHEKDRSVIRYAGRLEHVVRDKHDRDFGRQFSHEILDLGRCNRIEC